MTTKLTTAILLLLSATLGTTTGQASKHCSSYGPQTAQRDLTKGTPNLFLFGGIAPVKRAGDSAVEKKYGFVYHDFGCVRPTDDRCLRAYSQVVFTYLDKKYGKSWRTSVRQDVLFLTALP